jgi:tetratricopeptide (TPR) repeat protein
MTRLTVPLVLALALASWGLARANQESEAKTAYAKGRDYFKAGKYAQAIVELKRAYELKPHPALLRYMGDTYFKMNKARLAIEHYRRYLTDAPEAPDREKVEAKVKQLELVVGTSDDEERTPPPSAAAVPVPVQPPPPPQPQLQPTPPPPGPSRSDLPLGEDREVPRVLARPQVPSIAPTGDTEPAARRKSSALVPLKWTAAAVGVAGLALGVVFNRLAASKAADLENRARVDGCPDPPTEGCGNPDLNRPAVTFKREHYDLQESYKTNNTVALASFIGGGVFAATAIVLFTVDAVTSERRPSSTGRSVVLAPLLGGGHLGVAGQVAF